MKCLLFSLFILPFAAGAQKIKTSQFDAAKKLWHIETFPVNLKSTGESKTDASLVANGDTLLLQLTGSGAGANTVIAGDRLIFLLDGDSTVTLTSPTVQLANRTTYKHNYSLGIDELEGLSRHGLQGLRKYTTDGYHDIFLDKQNGAKLKELSTVFLAEVKKTGQWKAAKTLAQPAFPGGREVLLRFLNRNLKPLQGLEVGDRKFLLAQFDVDSDGGVSNLSIKQSAGEPFDTEAIRMLKRMPKWKPAVVSGRPAETTVLQPLTFLRTEAGWQIRF